MTAMTTHVATGSVTLDTVLEILADAVGELEAINNRSLPMPRPDEADTTRSLLHLGDQLNLASSLVRNEYWHVRGRQSYEL